jgi:general secretion pathway protein C
MEWMASPKGGQLARVLALILGVLAVYWLAEMVWLALPTADDQAPVVVASAPVPRAKSAELDARQLAQWHLFGEAGKDAVQQAAPIDAPETRLNLTLHGVIAADIPENARAIIAEQNRNERSYRIGDNLPGGAELSEVHADRVILRRAGRYETLRLPKQSLSGNEAAVDEAADNSVLDPAAVAVLNEYRDIMQTNPRALIDLVRPVPHQEGSQFIGFRLYPGNRRELFNQFGLRPGDLVTEVNGVTLDNAAKGIEVLNQLKEAQQINLRIRRGRQEIDLNFSLS